MKKQKETKLFHTPRFDAESVTYRTDNGKSFTHTIIKSNPSMAIILKNDNEQIAFIKNFRTTTGQYYLELPAGIQELGETDVETAERELKEETGYTCKNTKLLVIGPSLLDPSKSNEDFGVAIADAGSQESRNLDSDEQISQEILWLNENEVFTRLYFQMQLGTPFYNDLYLSGHSIYALLSYKFLYGSLL